MAQSFSPHARSRSSKASSRSAWMRRIAPVIVQIGSRSSAPPDVKRTATVTNSFNAGDACCSVLSLTRKCCRECEMGEEHKRPM